MRQPEGNGGMNWSVTHHDNPLAHSFNSAGWDVIVEFSPEEGIFYWWLSNPDGDCEGTGTAHSHSRAVIEGCKVWAKLTGQDGYPLQLDQGGSGTNV